MGNRRVHIMLIVSVIEGNKEETLRNYNAYPIMVEMGSCWDAKGREWAQCCIKRS